MEIRDGDYRSDRIMIDIEKTGPNKELVDHFVINKTIVDIGQGIIFVLQLVSFQLYPTFVLYWRLCIVVSLTDRGHRGHQHRVSFQLLVNIIVDRKLITCSECERPQGIRLLPVGSQTLPVSGLCYQILSLGANGD